MDLDHETESRIVTALRRIMRGIELHSGWLEEACGLTGPQLAVLRAAERIGAASIGTLAREVHLSHATVSGIVTRLAARELVRRDRSTDDLRSTLITVTDPGKELVETAPALLQDRFRVALHALQPWERMQILSVLERVGLLMGVDQVDAAPHLAAGSDLSGEHAVKRAGEV